VSITIGIYFGKNKNSIPNIAPALSPSSQQLDTNKIEELQISKREMEVLDLIAQGLSNKEIGERLFVSESTVKTHVSNLLVKLDSKRRTQAVNRAKELNIII
jgi:ATP/maltotriose-dependent transcriptional regulator MalT